MTHHELKKKRIDELVVAQREVTKQLSLNRFKRFVRIHRDSRYNNNTNGANRNYIDKTNIKMVLPLSANSKQTQYSCSSH